MPDVKPVDNTVIDTSFLQTIKDRYLKDQAYMDSNPESVLKSQELRSPQKVTSNEVRANILRETVKSSQDSAKDVRSILAKYTGGLQNSGSWL